MSELLHQSWKRTNALDTYTRASRISKKGWVGNLFEAQFCIAWIGICQCGRNRLVRIENKVDKSQRRLHQLTSLSLLTFYSTPGSYKSCLKHSTISTCTSCQSGTCKFSSLLLIQSRN